MHALAQWHVTLMATNAGHGRRQVQDGKRKQKRLGFFQLINLNHATSWSIHFTNKKPQKNPASKVILLSL